MQRTGMQCSSGWITWIDEGHVVERSAEITAMHCGQRFWTQVLGVCIVIVLAIQENCKNMSGKPKKDN